MPTSRATVDILNADATQVLYKSALLDTGVASSGALATQQLASGTGAQFSTTRNVTSYTPVTLTGVGGTATVQLSPDNSTYSTLAVVTPAINASITLVTVVVPAGWFIKITVASATLGVSTLV